MEDSFGDIIEPVSMALNNLTDLLELNTVKYYHDSPVIEDPIDFSKIGSIGFIKVTTLGCSHYFPSIHISNFVSLFPAVEELTLIHLDLHVAPNYGPLLTALKADSLQSLELNCVRDAPYKVEAGVYPIHQDLLRFRNLSTLKLLDRRVIDLDLVTTILGLELLDCLEIGKVCQVPFDLAHHLLSGLKNRNPVKELTFYLELQMEVGKIGMTYKDGAEPVLKNEILVPGVGWKQPIWSKISREEGIELVELAKAAGVIFYGTITNALKVEKAFEKELKWLDDSMYFMKTEKVRKKEESSSESEEELD